MSTPAGAPAGGDKRAVNSLVALAASGAAAVTLMACYGVPPCEADRSCAGGDGGIGGMTTSTASGTGGVTTSSTTTTTTTTTSSATTSSGTGGTGGAPPSCTHCDEQMMNANMDPAQICTASVPIWDNFIACACHQGGSCVASCNTGPNNKDPRCPGVAADAGTNDMCTVCLMNGCASQATACLQDN